MSVKRKFSLVGAVTVLTACLLASVLVGLSPAQPAGAPQSVTFGCLGFPQYFNVPPGVTQITVHAEGASGGSQGQSGNPGNGAKLDATLTVVPGHTLQIDVGCRGVSGFSATQDGGQGGFGFSRGGNGGQNSGASAAGVGGGGSTGIVDLGNITATGQSPVNVCDASGGGGGSFGDPVLLVAAGGGGGGNSGVLIGCNGGGRRRWWVQRRRRRERYLRRGWRR